MATRLKKEIVKKILVDATIWPALTKELKLVPVSLITALNRNKRLTELSTLKIISEHFSIPVDELDEKIPESDAVSIE